ncbi:MAG TPA: hypothetical protein VMI73_23290 [Trebonia sp.]|nr:hypothetical protein [Trebonia sp.]
MSDQFEPVEIETVDAAGRRVAIRGRKVHDEEAAHIWIVLMSKGHLAVVDRSEFNSTPVSHVYRGFSDFAAAYEEDNWPMVDTVRTQLAR